MRTAGPCYIRYYGTHYECIYSSQMVVCYIHFICNCTMGKITCYIYYMRVLCYRCSDYSVREQLWTLIYNRGWISDRYGYTLFYIPERYVPFALCIDSTLMRIYKEDYII